MLKLARIITGTALALALAGVAGVSYAEPIAAAHEKGTGTDIRWVKSTTGLTPALVGTGGHLFTGSSSAVAATKVPYTFDFNFDPLATLIGSLSTVDFFLDATVLNGNAATGLGTAQQQQQLNGNLSLTYTGLVPLSGCISGTCKNLLSAVFHDAWLVGGGNVVPGKGATIGFTAFNDPAVLGSFVTFTSDFYDFSDFTDLSLDFSLTSPTSITHLPGKAMSNFNASSSGTFAGVPPPVPEPAAWALMIMGFGGVGAMLRSRRRDAASLA